MRAPMRMTQATLVAVGVFLALVVAVHATGVETQAQGYKDGFEQAWVDLFGRKPTAEEMQSAALNPHGSAEDDWAAVSFLAEESASPQAAAQPSDGLPPETPKTSPLDFWPFNPFSRWKMNGQPSPNHPKNAAAAEGAGDSADDADGDDDDDDDGDAGDNTADHAELAPRGDDGDESRWQNYGSGSSAETTDAPAYKKLTSMADQVRRRHVRRDAPEEDEEDEEQAEDDDEEDDVSLLAVSADGDELSDEEKASVEKTAEKLTGSDSSSDAATEQHIGQGDIPKDQIPPKNLYWALDRVVRSMVPLDHPGGPLAKVLPKEYPMMVGMQNRPTERKAVAQQGTADLAQVDKEVTTALDISKHSVFPQEFKLPAFDHLTKDPDAPFTYGGTDHEEQDEAMLKQRQEELLQKIGEDEQQKQGQSCPVPSSTAPADDASASDNTSEKTGTDEGSDDSDTEKTTSDDAGDGTEDDGEDGDDDDTADGTLALLQVGASSAKKHHGNKHHGNKHHGNSKHHAAHSEFFAGAPTFMNSQPTYNAARGGGEASPGPFAHRQTPGAAFATANMNMNRGVSPNGQAADNTYHLPANSNNVPYVPPAQKPNMMQRGQAEITGAQRSYDRMFAAAAASGKLVSPSVDHTDGLVSPQQLAAQQQQAQFQKLRQAQAAQAASQSQQQVAAAAAAPNTWAGAYNTRVATGVALTQAQMQALAQQKQQQRGLVDSLSAATGVIGGLGTPLAMAGAGANALPLGSHLMYVPTLEYVPMIVPGSVATHGVAGQTLHVPVQQLQAQQLGQQYAAMAQQHVAALAQQAPPTTQPPQTMAMLGALGATGNVYAQAKSAAAVQAALAQPTATPVLTPEQAQALRAQQLAHQQQQLVAASTPQAQYQRQLQQGDAAAAQQLQARQQQAAAQQAKLEADVRRLQGLQGPMTPGVAGAQLAAQQAVNIEAMQRGGLPGTGAQNFAQPYVAHPYARPIGGVAHNSMARYW